MAKDTKAAATPAPEVEGVKVSSATGTKDKGISLENNVVGLLSWLLGPLSSAIFYFTEKDSTRWAAVKKDVMQSLYYGLVVYIGGGIVMGVVSTVITVLTLGIGGICMGCIVPLVFLAAFGYAIYAGVKAYQGQSVDVPVIKDWVK